MNKETQAISNDIGTARRRRPRLDGRHRRRGRGKSRAKPANASPPRWNAPRKSRATSATRRSPAQKPPTKPCMNIPIKPSPSASVSGRYSVISLPAGVPAIAIDRVMEESTVSFRQLAATSKTFRAAAGDHRGKPARIVDGGSAGGARASLARLSAGPRRGGVRPARRPHAYGGHRGFVVGLARWPCC